MRSNTVASTIDRAVEAQRGVVVGYLPLGYPDLDTSVEAATALLKEGVDILELGLPYSDPVMDGPVIQKASQIALEGGLRVKQLFPAVREITSRASAPVLVMTYWNPVVQYGVRRFAEDLLEAGGAGLITPDLVPDEAGEWLSVSDELDAERVFLAAPSSSDERLSRTTQLSKGFVYAVSTMGITGARTDLDQAARTLVSRLRQHGAPRVCVGLGISTRSQVGDVLSFADGAIVGSALIHALGLEGVSGLRDLARELAYRPEAAAR